MHREIERQMGQKFVGPPQFFHMTKLGITLALTSELPLAIF